MLKSSRLFKTTYAQDGGFVVFYCEKSGLDELQDLINVPVAIGFEPAWHEADNTNMISARKDGVIGTY